MDEKEARAYFKEEISPIFEQLIAHLVKERPQDILNYTIKWFKKENALKNSQTVFSQDQDDEHYFTDVSDEDFTNWKNSKLKSVSTRRRRIAYSAEVFGKHNHKNELIVPKGVEKSEDIVMRLLFMFMNSFLFDRFKENEKMTLVRNMLPLDFEPGEHVFQMGDLGDGMYYVVSGRFNCIKDKESPAGHDLMQRQSTSHSKKQQRGVVIVHSLISGETFGELALMHNCPRSYSVVCTQAGQVFKLKSSIYRNLMNLSVVTKHDKYVETLKKVSLFKGSDANQLDKICSVLVQVQFSTDSYVIVEGDIGNRFYIVLSGLLVALHGDSENVLQCYTSGDCFGELALINDCPRKASVKTITKSRLVYLTQGVFKRLVRETKVFDEINQKYLQQKSWKPPLVKKRFND